MIRFSCFQAHTHSHKQKRTVQLSTEAMQKTLEDASQRRTSKNYAFLVADNKTFVKEDGDALDSNADHATDSSVTERDCRSEEMGSEYNAANGQIKKCLSLGSRLNWKERTPHVCGSEDEMEQKVYSGGSADHCEIIELSYKGHGLSMSDHYQEPMPSDSVQVNSDFPKGESIFSIGDPQVLEKECTDEDGINLSGGGDSDDHTPCTLPAIVRSCSLPGMASPKRLSRSVLPCSRSSEDLNALYSRKKGILHEVGRKLPHQGDYSALNNDNNSGEYPVDDTYETYNIGSAKDWIIPGSDGANMGKVLKGETSFHHWNEVPTKDFKLKRIEEWVSDLKHCSSLEESNDFTSSDERKLPKVNDSLEELTVAKPEIKASPGMEAVKRYISSLNASATAAQLTNLGLTAIPFLSAFASLKALNLCGNTIVRISAGALPRGLHILNLSRNNISTIEGLRDLTRLRVLDLSYNRILRIGHGLAGCSSIKELYLAGNKISEVEGLHRLLKLNVLDLRFNKITTAKCLGQLASNYNCLQALSLEGNPAQKNVGDEQLKKHVQSLLPHLTYYNRQSIKVGKDTGDRSAARLGIGAHQIDRGLRVEVKNSRKGTHGIVAQKASSIHGRKSQVASTQKTTKISRHVRPPPSGMKVADFSSRLMSLRNDLSSMPRSASVGKNAEFVQFE